jgi:hypothetical protein
MDRQAFNSGQRVLHVGLGDVGRSAPGNCLGLIFRLCSLGLLGGAEMSPWDWLRDEGNQGALKILGGIIAATVLAGWTFFIWQQSSSKPTPVSTPVASPAPTTTTPPPTLSVQYKVCVGEYEAACLPHDVYLYCGTDADAWAKARCLKFSSTVLNSRGGNKCGYSLMNYVCIQELPK